jgi:transposase-like protein
MGRYAQSTKDKAVARLLPPESTAVEVVAQEFGISADTLRRWQGEALSRPAGPRAWAAAARLEAVLTTASMDDSNRNAWCRSHGVYPQELAQWRQTALQALADPQDARATPQQTRADQKRIKELERNVRRKDKALAETTALLVLSKKLEAIFHEGEAE